MAEVLDALIVGGGLAGLAAALELQRQGQRVLLIEKEARLGGKAGSVQTSAGEFPLGPSSFNGRHPSFWKLIDLLGLEDQVVKLAPHASSRFIVRNSRLEGLRPSPFSVLFTGALTAGEKASLAKEFLFAKKPTSSDDESLRTLLERRFGKALVDHFLEAVMTGIFAGDLSKLSAQACMPALATAEREYGSVIKGALKSMGHAPEGTRAGLYTFRDGFGVIGQRALEKVPARLGQSVEWVRVSGDGVSLMANGEVHRARSLVLATEADVASRLLAGTLPDVSKQLAAFDYAPVTLAQWAESSPGDSKLPEGFGYLSAPIEGRFAMGTLFIGDLRGETPRRFTSFIGGALAPERAGLSDGALFDGVREDVRALTGGVVGRALNIVRWPRAVAQPRVGHLGQVERLMSSLKGTPVSVAGSYLGGAAMKDALSSGFAAAEKRPVSPLPDPLPREGRGREVFAS